MTNPLPAGFFFGSAEGDAYWSATPEERKAINDKKRAEFVANGGVIAPEYEGEDVEDSILRK